jgi:hypothetical protein
VQLGSRGGHGRQLPHGAAQARNAHQSHAQDLGTTTTRYTHQHQDFRIWLGSPYYYKIRKTFLLCAHVHFHQSEVKYVEIAKSPIASAFVLKITGLPFLFGQSYLLLLQSVSPSITVVLPCTSKRLQWF